MRALYPQLGHTQVAAALRYARTYRDDVEERIALADAMEHEAMETIPTMKAS